VCICVALMAARGFAFETDQFTVPPKPLVDLGAEFQAEVARSVQRACDRVNEHYRDHLARAAKARFRFVRESEEKGAADCLREVEIVEAVFNATVRGGYPQCQMELWARAGEFARQPARFEVSAGRSVYDTIHRPITVFYLSPTINLHAVYLGTDKLGHLFEQGYEYWEVFTAEMARGGSEAAAYRKAVKLGIDQENGFYGTAIDSVYSNGDMAANYAGLKFYLNLTRPMVINGVRREPIVVLRDNEWRVNPAADRNFMRVFITDHYNEAMNPSEYGWPLRKGVAANVRKLAGRWLEFYGSSAGRERQRLEGMARMYEEDYGHSGFRKVVTIPEAVVGGTE